MSRLPTVGADNNAWGTVLNAFLEETAGYNVGDYGAVANGVTDDAAAIQAALNAAAAAGGGTVVLPPAVLAFNGAIHIPGNVGMVGQGADNVTSATRLLCKNSAATVTVGGATDLVTVETSGPTIGHFEIDGDGVATNPFQVGYVVSRYFENLMVRDGATTTAVVAYGQNHLFNMCGFRGGPTALALDYGTGGNLFNKCEIQDATSWNLIFRQTGTSPNVYAVPSQNAFYHCIVESYYNSVPGLVEHLQGDSNTFVSPVFALSTSNGATSLVKLTYDGSHASGDLRINDGTFFGNVTYTTGIEVTASCTAYLEGLTYFTNCLNAHKTVAGSYLSVENVFQSNVTNWNSGGVETSSVFTTRRSANQILRPGATDIFHVGDLVAGNRCYEIHGSTIEWGPATNYTMDTTIGRSQANVVATGADDAFRTAKSTTGARPSAATLGEGAQWYDTTLHTPIWSDGTNWRNGIGTVV